MSLNELDRNPWARVFGGGAVCLFMLIGAALFARAGVEILRSGSYSHPTGTTLTGWQANLIGSAFLFFAVLGVAAVVVIVYGLIFR